MKRRTLLDSFAILAWIQGEQGDQIVEDLLYRAQAAEAHLLLSVINLGEVYYRCARVRNIDFAEDVIEKIRLLPVSICPCPEAIVMQAAKLKAGHPLAYADAIALATAIEEKASILTGDPEFRKVEHLVKIQWLI